MRIISNFFIIGLFSSLLSCNFPLVVQAEEVGNSLAEIEEAAKINDGRRLFLTTGGKIREAPQVEDLACPGRSCLNHVHPERGKICGYCSQKVPVCNHLEPKPGQTFVEPVPPRKDFSFYHRHIRSWPVAKYELIRESVRFGNVKLSKEQVEKYLNFLLKEAEKGIFFRTDVGFRPNLFGVETDDEYVILNGTMGTMRAGDPTSRISYFLFVKPKKDITGGTLGRGKGSLESADKALAEKIFQTVHGWAAGLAGAAE